MDGVGHYWLGFPRNSRTFPPHQKVKVELGPAFWECPHPGAFGAFPLHFADLKLPSHLVLAPLVVGRLTPYPQPRAFTLHFADLKLPSHLVLAPLVVGRLYYVAPKP